jgi:hypothetical protein
MHVLRSAVAQIADEEDRRARDLRQLLHLLRDLLRTAQHREMPGHELRECRSRRATRHAMTGAAAHREHGGDRMTPPRRERDARPEVETGDD